MQTAAGNPAAHQMAQSTTSAGWHGKLLNENLPVAIGEGFSAFPEDLL